jgi:hypothetical protein
MEGGEHDGEEEGGQEEEVAFQRVSEVPFEGGAASSRSRDERWEVFVNGEEEGGQEEEVVWIAGSGDDASPGPL